MREYDRRLALQLFLYLLIMIGAGALATGFIHQAPERAAKLQGKINKLEKK